MTERLLLERLGADAWPPLEQVVVDGWRLRASRGVTRRGNSALPLTDARPLKAVQQFFAERGLPATGYARIRVDGRTVAVARGVVQEGWLGVFAMAVLPDHRRRGLASLLLAALGTWAGERGATCSYLQVRRDNDAAIALYGRHAMAAAYPYAYRYVPRA